MKPLLTLSLSILLFTLAQAQTTDSLDTDTTNTSCIELTNTKLYYKPNLKPYYRAKDTNTNGEVSLLQGFLHDNNYTTLEPTGYFGSGTRNAVKKFQVQVGIASSLTKATGNVGALTREKIKEISCSDVQEQDTATVSQNTTQTTSSEQDPGSGLWIPKGMKDVYVVDVPRVNDFSLTGEVNIPGVIFTKIKDYSATELRQADVSLGRDPISKITLDAKPGKVISIRYRTAKTSTQKFNYLDDGVIGGDFKLAGATGDSILFKVSLSASLTPGDFSCGSDGKIFTAHPLLIVSSSPLKTSMNGINSCVIPPDTDYYLNIRVEKDPRAIQKAVQYKDSDGINRYRHESLEDGNCSDSLVVCPQITVVNSGKDITLKFKGGNSSVTPSVTTTQQPSQQNQVSNWPFSDRDPGVGLWIPKGSSNLFVVDAGGIGNVEQLPGTIFLNNSLLNGKPSTSDNLNLVRPGYKTKDFYQDPKTGTVVDFKDGKTISLRYRMSGANSTSVTNVAANPFPPDTLFGYYRLYGQSGDSFGYNVTLSASRIPGDFSDTTCTYNGASPSPQIRIASARPLSSSFGQVCIIPKDTEYYVNIKFNKSYNYIRKAVKDADGYYTISSISDGDCTKEEILCPTFKFLAGNHSTAGFSGGSNISTQSTTAGQSSVIIPPSDSRSGTARMFLVEKVGLCTPEDKERVKNQFCPAGIITSCVKDKITLGGVDVSYQATGCNGKTSSQ